MSCRNTATCLPRYRVELEDDAYQLCHYSYTHAVYCRCYVYTQIYAEKQVGRYGDFWATL